MIAPDAMAVLHARVFAVPRPWTAAEFTTLRADPTVFEAHCTDGFAIGRAVADEAELLTLVVAPEARRRGHGSRLLARFEAAARARGAATAFLEVAESNAAACALYAGAGYCPAGRRRRYYAVGDGPAADALVLRKNLAETLG